MTSDSLSTRQIAEAFSSHRFGEAYDHLAPDVVWVAVGAFTLRGRDEVVAACEATLSQLAGASTEFVRFLSVADDQTAVVDAIGHYTGADGEVSVVASADVYEFRDHLVTQITSYTVELEEQA